MPALDNFGGCYIAKCVDPRLRSTERSGAAAAIVMTVITAALS